MPLCAGQVSVSPVLQMVKPRHEEVKRLAQGCAVSGDRSRAGAESCWLAQGGQACPPCGARPAVRSALPARKYCLPSPGEELLSSQHNQVIECCVLGFFGDFFLIYGFSFN